MRWKRRGRSRNLEDRRDERPGGGLRFPFPMGGGRRGGPRVRLPGGVRVGRRPRLSLGTLLLLLLFFFLFRGSLFGGGTTAQAPFPKGSGGGGIELPFPSPSLPGGPSRPGAPGPVGAGPSDEEEVEFVSFVLDDLQETWHRLLPGYRDAKLVLFRDSVRSGCGFAAAQMGPFYCPADEKVYIDLSFYRDLRERFGAPGDFAQAYVLAHEIGHHVQKVTGVEPQVRRAQQDDPSRRNELSVRMELMADCLAGVWGASAGERDLLEPGDIEEGLGAAAAIGDDRLQKMQGGRVQPESFTHGSSAQRVEWLQRGLRSGDPSVCDTL